MSILVHILHGYTKHWEVLWVVLKTKTGYQENVITLKGKLETHKQ